MITRISSPWRPLFHSSILSGVLLLLVACDHVLGTSLSAATNHDGILFPAQQTKLRSTAERTDYPEQAEATLPNTLQALLGAIEVMQEQYFDVFTGGWPTSIDWTAAVLGTHISATLASIVTSIEYSPSACTEALAWENTVDKYFAHTSIFYFGQNDFALRNEAYDDMLWVVLGWLENVKFMNLRSDTYWRPGRGGAINTSWHGLQFSASASHRARIFYDLASKGWDTSLCDGGMVWNPRLTPYKNAITNELFISASIAMYLYFPGDNNESPYLASQHTLAGHRSHNPRHLLAAIDAYQWLDRSQMKNWNGLYADGYHIRDWRRYPNGTIDPGTGNCDELNRMVYTYNQGVILTAQRGLWIATGNSVYLEHGHKLVSDVIKATGWERHDGNWHGLGRDGVLEEFCDHAGQCSQDGQTFKGIFFHHMTEFCRPLWPVEEGFIQTNVEGGLNMSTYQHHQRQCASYGAWISHNAEAALATRDEKGMFGQWWGRTYPDTESQSIREKSLRTDEVDYRNAGVPSNLSNTWRPGKSEDKNLHGESSLRKQSQTCEACEEDTIKDVNDRGRGRTVETQSGGLAILRALWQWESPANTKQH